MTWSKGLESLSELKVNPMSDFELSVIAKQRLLTCDTRLQIIVNAAAKRIHFQVLCGHRGEKEQNDAFERGMSKLRWPQSRHNSNPSQAVDLAPLPIDWHNTDRFKTLAMIVMDEASKAGVKLRWGGDFNMNSLPDDKFVDLPHYELHE